mgnify:CR=1 FL=1
MIGALLLSVALFLLAIASHLTTLGAAHRLVDRRTDLSAKMAVSLMVLFSHLPRAALFCSGSVFVTACALGSFHTPAAMTWMDYFYFSLINVTTLGLGDIYPTDHLRVIAGIEALTGFALISCSAQLFWKMMTQGETQ